MIFDSNTHAPITFKTKMPVRITDIDRYGHVSTTHYIEYVFAHRYDYIRDCYGAGPDLFVEKGIGFFTRRIQIEFLRPIPAAQVEVAIESVAHTVDGPRFPVDFKILHPAGDPVHAVGQIDFRVIDLARGAPCPMPEWLFDWIFTKK